MKNFYLIVLLVIKGCKFTREFKWDHDKVATNGMFIEVREKWDWSVENRIGHQE